jgi:hypothetical protein
MTKTVRIENACTSDFTLEVQVWDKTANGEKLVESFPLNYPANMKETYITSTRYLKIVETGIRPE